MLSFVTNFARTAIGSPVISILILIVTVLSIRLGLASREIGDLQLEKDEIALVHTNALATADTTRRLNVVLADSNVMWARLAVQREELVDSLAETLEAVIVSRTELLTTIASLDTNLISEVTDTADVRIARWDLYQEPFTVEVEAHLPKPPAQGRLNLNVNLDPALLVMRVGCLEALGRTHQAEVFVQTPWWLTAEVTNVEQTQGVCQPYRVPDTSSSGSGSSIFADVILGGLASGLVALIFDEDVYKGTAIGVGAGVFWHVVF